MCDQNNINDQSVTNLKFKRLMCDQNNLNDQFFTHFKLKGTTMSFSLFSFTVNI